jgi:hypothetical protein
MRLRCIPTPVLVVRISASPYVEWNLLSVVSTNDRMSPCTVLGNSNLCRRIAEIQSELEELKATVKQRFATVHRPSSPTAPSPLSRLPDSQLSSIQVSSPPDPGAPVSVHSNSRHDSLASDRLRRLNRDASQTKSQVYLQPTADFVTCELEELMLTIGAVSYHVEAGSSSCVVSIMLLSKSEFFNMVVVECGTSCHLRRPAGSHILRRLSSLQKTRLESGAKVTRPRSRTAGI